MAMVATSSSKCFSMTLVNSAPDLTGHLSIEGNRLIAWISCFDNFWHLALAEARFVQRKESGIVRKCSKAAKWRPEEKFDTEKSWCKNWMRRCSKHWEDNWNSASEVISWTSRNSWRYFGAERQEKCLMSNSDSASYGNKSLINAASTNLST